jgi:hypothetical protein
VGSVVCVGCGVAQHNGALMGVLVMGGIGASRQTLGNHEVKVGDVLRQLGLDGESRCQLL